jgi:hypothetical protein
MSNIGIGLQQDFEPQRLKVIFLKGWEANLVARLVVTANSLGSNTDIPQESQSGRHKQRSGQHTLARQKI